MVFWRSQSSRAPPWVMLVAAGEMRPFTMELTCPWARRKGKQRTVWQEKEERQAGRCPVPTQWLHRWWLGDGSLTGGQEFSFRKIDSEVPVRHPGRGYQVGFMVWNSRGYSDCEIYLRINSIKVVSVEVNEVHWGTEREERNPEVAKSFKAWSNIHFRKIFLTAV